MGSEMCIRDRSKPPPSQYKSVTLGCSDSSGGKSLFLSGIVQKQTGSSGQLQSGELGYLGLQCADYKNVFNMSDAAKTTCCIGSGSGCYWGDYRPGTKPCDEFMAKHCAPLCSEGSCTDPVCGCIGSILSTSAQCFDTKCRDEPAYRTKSMSQSMDCKGKVLTCDQLAALGPSNVATGVTLPTGCGSPPPPPSEQGWLAWLKNNPVWAVVFVVFVILLAFALKPPKQSKRTLPPPGALPPLPSLSDVN